MASVAVRVNPWYGWGFDSDPLSGKTGLYNLVAPHVRSRMETLLRVEGSRNVWAWSKETAMRVLRNGFITEYAHKKRGRWDQKLQGFYIKSRSGVETRLDMP
jgi:hypothetical protein